MIARLREKYRAVIGGLAWIVGLYLVVYELGDLWRSHNVWVLVAVGGIGYWLGASNEAREHRDNAEARRDYDERMRQQ
jgi:hypothetical protein